MARVALGRGEVLWRYGLPQEALVALRAGVPRASRPPLSEESVLAAQAAGRLQGPPWRWKKKALIGHYSQNLFVAGRLLEAAGRGEEARAHFRAAALAGLPEAREALKARAQ